ncbi:MAG: hypothetical protein GXP31_01685 [Kiritimatiellaeota bacterium]|nr:hypothetical protein [Kiritimatiellota bacterium]
MQYTGSIAEARRFLERPGPLLLLSHQRPDGDAIGSVVGLLLALRAAGRESIGYLKGPLARRYSRLLPETPGLFVGAPPPLPPGLSVVALDTTSWERVEKPPNWQTARDVVNVLDVDHHPDNTAFGNAVWVDSGKAATAAMLAELLPALGVQFLSEAATWFLVGLVMDTGGFRFANTDAAALRTAAELVDRGADCAAIMDGLFFREPFERRRLESDLLASARFACDGRVVYAVLDPARLRKAGLNQADIEGVIDVLRGFDGPLVAALFQAQPEFVKVSLRSRSPQIRVDRVAHALGGGGHRAAAGAEVRDLDLPAAQAKTIELLERILSE